MKKILLIALGAVSLLLGSCTKDNGGGEPVPVAVQSVSLNKPATSILEGATETLTAVVAPAEAKNKAVSWSTSSADVATVSEAGLVTAVKAGTAIITVTTQDGNKTATCVVTVSKTVIPVTGVSLNKATTSIVEGSTETLTAVVAPATATNQNVIWVSSDAAIATVSTAGVVTAIKAGTAIIMATTHDGQKVATCVVTVSKMVIHVTGVSLNKATTSIFVGATETLTAVVAPADATNQNVIWTSSDAAIATVSDAGLVTAIKEGTAIITVTSVADNTKIATCVVTVSPIVVTGVSVDRTATTIAVGASKTSNATVLPANASNKAVTWTSSDVAIATVSAAGLVTAVKAGTATITVTTQDGNKTATCTVTAVVAVERGNLRWAVGNLVADGANGCKIGSPTDGGLYFHSGSLVGWQGGATGDGTGVANASLEAVIQVKPTGYMGSTTWPAGCYTAVNNADDEGYTYPATDDPSTGIGDPCRHYLGAPWRTPTSTEYRKIFGYLGNANSNKSVPLQVTDVELVFPGSGYRFDFIIDSGELYDVGVNGYYWASSAYAAFGSCMTFCIGDVNSRYTTGHEKGCNVRCVASL